MSALLRSTRTLARTTIIHTRTPPTTLRPATAATAAQAQALPFSTTAAARADDHGSHYDAPSGWLWGVPPGQKPEKEGWENIWYWGFYGSLGMGIVAYAFKPDSSIETWALEEAKRRLQAEGTLPEDE